MYERPSPWNSILLQECFGYALPTHPPFSLHINFRLACESPGKILLEIWLELIELIDDRPPPAPISAPRGVAQEIFVEWTSDECLQSTSYKHAIQVNEWTKGGQR